MTECECVRLGGWHRKEIEKQTRKEVIAELWSSLIDPEKIAVYGKTETQRRVITCYLRDYFSIVIEKGTKYKAQK